MSNSLLQIPAPALAKSEMAAVKTAKEALCEAQKNLKTARNGITPLENKLANLQAQLEAAQEKLNEDPGDVNAHTQIQPIQHAIAATERQINAFNEGLREPQQALCRKIEEAAIELGRASYAPGARTDAPVA